jgi:hypothetical protein
MTVQEVSGILQGAAPTVALILVVLSLRQQTRQLQYQQQAIEGQQAEQARAIEVLRFEVYERVTQRYADLLERASSDQDLNRIYQPLDSRRQHELDAAQAADPGWGAWEIMDFQEQKCFRYTRLALEVCEQAHKVEELGWIDDETWRKWHTWTQTFSRTRYFPYVLDIADERSRGRFRPAFVRYVEGEVLTLKPHGYHWTLRVDKVENAD